MIRVQKYGKARAYIIAVALFISLFCIQGTASAANTASFSDTNVQEQVVVDEQGMRITVTGYEVSEWGMEEVVFPVTIENTTDSSISISATLASVNGYMIDPHWHTDVEARATATDKIGFYLYELEANGIEKVAELELSFSVTSEDGSIDFVTSPGIIHTSVYGNYTQNYDDSGEVLIDDAGIKVVAKELDTNNYGAYQYLYIENNTDVTVHLCATDHKINGNSVPDLESNYPDIAPGKKAREALGYGNGDLSKAGANSVESVSATLTFTNADTDEEIISDQVYVGDDSRAAISAPEIVEGVAYSDEFVEVSVNGIEVGNVGDSTISVSIKNVSVSEIAYSFDHVNVNGLEVKGYSGQGLGTDYLQKIEVEGTYETSIGIRRNSLRALGISQIQSIEIGMTFMNYQAVIHDIAFDVPFADGVTTSTGELAASNISERAADYYVDTMYIHGSTKTFTVGVMRNPNSVPVSLRVVCHYRDEDKNEIGSNEDTLYYLDPGAHAVCIYGTEEDFYYASFSVFPTVVTKKRAALSYTVEKGEDTGCTIRVTNDGDNRSNHTQLRVIFLKNNAIYGYAMGFANGDDIEIGVGETLTREVLNMDYDSCYVFLSGIAD